MNKPTPALRKVIEHAGSQSELARRLSSITGRNIKQGHIHYWIENGVSADIVIPMAQSTDFRVTPNELNSDLYPNPTDAIPPSEQAQA